MAVIQSILAKVLIQVGADEPREIGTIEIPIQIGVPEKTMSGTALSYPPGVRSGGQNIADLR